MAVYKIKGVDNFIPALLQGSPLSGDASILAKVATIKRIESYYGSLLDYEVVEECILSSKVTLIYYVIQYDRGPLFGTVTVYNSHGKQVVTRFNFQTDVTKLWNANLPCRP